MYIGDTFAQNFTSISTDQLVCNIMEVIKKNQLQFP